MQQSITRRQQNITSTLRDIIKRQQSTTKRENMKRQGTTLTWRTATTNTLCIIQRKRRKPTSKHTKKPTQLTHKGLGSGLKGKGLVLAARGPLLFSSGADTAILAAPAMSGHYRFSDLGKLLAKANEEKSGDQLAGIAASSERERIAAKIVLADLPLLELLNNPVIPAETDEVTRFILESHDIIAFEPIRSMTVGQFREFILKNQTRETELKSLKWGITPEMAAAVAKLMSNKDLVLAAAKISNVTQCRNTMGERGVLGIRLQPNHPSDDVGGILLAAFDGLLYGCGDAVIGVNPATDSVERVSTILSALDRLITAFDIPTQACCLAHITTQLECIERGAPVDLLFFQSVAGTEAANTSFGIQYGDVARRSGTLREHHGKRDVRWLGENVMYFETGQGSALSAEAHHGVDQLTLEARAYGVARAFNPFLVNSVVGFIVDPNICTMSVK